MALIVQKFGGSSVADISCLKRVAERIVETRKAGNQVVVVVSAMGDSTDNLVDLSEQITDAPAAREMDMLLSSGEQASASLLAMAVEALGVKAIAFTGNQAGVLTDDVHTQARILDIKPDRIKEALRRRKVVIVAGFQGVNKNKDIATLGRGGSDLSAVAMAAALNAASCEIFTDVEGIYTADPRIVPKAQKLSKISFDEMLELASLGAQVMQARSMEVAKKFGVNVHLRSSFSKAPGTMICEEVKPMEQMVVSGVTTRRDEAKITVCDVPDNPGLAAIIFNSLSESNVNVDVIVQNVSHTGLTDLSFTVSKAELKKALQVTKKVSKEIGAGSVSHDEKIAKISVVGIGMRSRSGIAAKMFEALAKQKINIEMISTSEIKISCIIRQDQATKAVKAIHDYFELDKVKKKTKLGRKVSTRRTRK